MKLFEVPASELLVISSDMEELVRVLRSVERWRSGFIAFTIIRGTPRTGRVFMVNLHKDAVRLPGRLPPGAMVHEMQRLGGDARYNPPENPGMVKGWEVRKATIEGEPTVIIWTAWVPPT